MIQNPPTRDLLGKARTRTKKKKPGTCSRPEALKPEKFPEANMENVKVLTKGGGGDIKRRLKLMRQMYKEMEDRRTRQWCPGHLYL